MGRGRAHRIGTGEHDARPRAGAEARIRDRLDPQQRHQPDLMAAGTQPRRGPPALRFRPGDKKAHALTPR